LSQAVAELEARVSAIESSMGSGGETEPFIGSELRPDLVGGPDYATPQGADLQARMAAGDRDAKIAFDTLPPA
jgi:immune inhibitor A